MGLRTVIVEKDSEARAMINTVVSTLGHEIEEVAGPEFCQTYLQQEHSCISSEPCHDIQILNNLMDDKMTGLEFLNWQKECGCKINQGNSAVISGDWPANEVKLADCLGIKAFTKPFLVKEMVDWLYHIKKVKRTGFIF